MHMEISGSVAAPAERVSDLLVDVAGSPVVIGPVDPARSCTVAAESRGAPNESRFDVMPTGVDGRTLALSFDGRPQVTGRRVLGATIGRLFLTLERNAIEKDLADIATAAESRA
jgi:hypothetical protein